MLRGFPPVVAADTHTLILGSFPGEASLAATQYYAHPRNQFWRLLGAVLDEPFAELAYEERLRRLLSHGIGVWDVLAACHREGSLDAAIRNAQPNDFASLREHSPKLCKPTATERPRAASCLLSAWFACRSAAIAATDTSEKTLCPRCCQGAIPLAGSSPVLAPLAAFPA